MKKVNSPKLIKLGYANKVIKTVGSPFIKLNTVKNPMINYEKAKNKKGGTTFKDYNLDLMKLR